MKFKSLLCKLLGGHKVSELPRIESYDNATITKYVCERCGGIMSVHVEELVRCSDWQDTKPTADGWYQVYIPGDLLNDSAVVWRYWLNGVWWQPPESSWQADSPIPPGGCYLARDTNVLGGYVWRGIL